MLGWPIPSAVFIDYENVAYRVLPGTIANWVAWLERGESIPMRAGSDGNSCSSAFTGILQRTTFARNLSITTSSPSSVRSSQA